MKLDPTALRYLTANDFRVLTAVELGMRNHELVPIPLTASISKLPRPLTKQHLSSLLKHKLVAHDGQKYDGYKLTYLGYDFLALRALVKRGQLSGVGMRVGVGKESDIHICQSPEGRTLCLKLHRLGRVSFRTIKRNRDYLQHRQSASWMYLARLAAIKEFAYMKALAEKGFPVPEPIDISRHAILMDYVDATPFCQVKELAHADAVLENLMRLIVRFAKCGLIHGDFNEFNLLIDDDEKVTVIDFPQIISTTHPNAAFYFKRDVDCVRNYFQKRFRIEVVTAPEFSDVAKVLGSQEDPEDNFGSAEDAVVIGQAELGSFWSKEDTQLLESSLCSMVVETGVDDDKRVDEGIIPSGIDDDGDDLSATSSESSSEESEGSLEEQAEKSGEEDGVITADVWKPKVRRPNQTKVRQKARRKQRAACGGGEGNAGKSKDRTRRKANFNIRMEA